MGGGLSDGDYGEDGWLILNACSSRDVNLVLIASIACTKKEVVSAALVGFKGRMYATWIKLLGCSLLSLI